MSGFAVPAVADVVVIGSGSAGSVIARRLADAGVDVVLLEAGESDANPAIHEPGRLFELWDSAQDWGYRTVPQAACAGRELQWPRGKVLGGSSALNGMIYVRGHRSDYDCRSSSARRTSTGARPSTTAPAAHSGSCRVTSPIRSAQLSSPRPKRRASPSTTTPTARNSTASPLPR